MGYSASFTFSRSKVPTNMRQCMQRTSCYRCGANFATLLGCLQSKMSNMIQDYLLNYSHPAVPDLAKFIHNNCSGVCRTPLLSIISNVFKVTPG